MSNCIAAALSSKAAGCSSGLSRSNESCPKSAPSAPYTDTFSRYGFGVFRTTGRFQIPRDHKPRRQKLGHAHHVSHPSVMFHARDAGPQVWGQDPIRFVLAARLQCLEHHARGEARLNRFLGGLPSSRPSNGAIATTDGCCARPTLVPKSSGPSSTSRSQQERNRLVNNHLSAGIANRSDTLPSANYVATASGEFVAFRAL